MRKEMAAKLAHGNYFHALSDKTRKAVNKLAGQLNSFLLGVDTEKYFESKAVSHLQLH